MRIVIAVVSLMLLFLFTFNSKAQETFNKTKLDNFLHQLEINNKAMLGVVITKNGKTEYENYTGFASVENKIKNNNQTKFRIGSITKMFTAAMIFQLIDEGKLTPATKLSEFYPQIPNSSKITIDEMLRHRSGIHDFTNDKDYSQYMTTPKSKEEMLNIIAKSKPDFEPGEKSVYSNSNYVLLGYIIEKITNSTYQKELAKRITSKLNLSNTYYGKKTDINKNEAFSYRFEDEKWQRQSETDMSIPHGAGAIVSTPRDLTKFINALFNNKIISAQSLNQMEEIKNGVGSGLFRFPFGKKIAYGHNGGIDGFVSTLAYFPEEKVAIAVTANGMNYSFNNILIGILSIYFNVPFDTPDLSEKAIHLSEKELKKYEGEFSSKLLPLKITLKVKDGQLYGQATGQSAFPLTPFSKTKFKFEPAGIVIEFAKDDSGKILYNSFILNQAGRKFPYER